MAAQITLILLCLIVGFAFGKKGFLNASNAPALVKLTVDAVLPCALFSTMRDRFSSESLIAAGPFLVIPFAGILVLFFLTAAIVRLLGLPKGRRGIFITMSSTSNTIFLGLPVSLALLGPGAMSGALMCYMANSSLFWSLGLATIRRDVGAAAETGGKKPSALFAWIRAFVNPPLVSLALSLVFIFTGLPLAQPLSSALSAFGAMSTPLALVYMGFSLSCLKKDDIVPDRALAGVIVFRAVVSPLLVFGLSRLYGLIVGTQVPRILETAFLIQAAMPVMGQSPIIARREGADEVFAARAAGLSLLLCPIPLAAIMMLY